MQVPGPLPRVTPRSSGTRQEKKVSTTPAAKVCGVPPQPTCFVAGVSRRTHYSSKGNYVHFFPGLDWSHHDQNVE